MVLSVPSYEREFKGKNVLIREFKRKDLLPKKKCPPQAEHSPENDKIRNPKPVFTDAD